jgi:beta-lactamase superfamily II metal-dependent hydrolase
MTINNAIRASLVVASCLLTFSTASAQTLRIYHIDVEQADSALIVMPNGKSLLIDSGNNGHGKRIKKVMAQAGVTQIDAFVASHYHADHFGGVDDLVKDGIAVVETYDRGRRDLVDEGDRDNGTYKAYMRTVGEDAIALEPGNTINLDPSVTVKCLASSGRVMGAGPMSSRDENDLSVSLLIEFAGFRAFFGGDAHQPVEALIEAGHLAKEVDLYKSSHHGSDTSSSAAFMRELNPALIVISNGSHGKYHHPRHDTLQIYRALTPRPMVIQTNRCKLRSPCDNMATDFIADTGTSGTDGTIQIVVDAGSRTYNVRYGASSVRTLAFKAAGSGPVGASLPMSVAVIESLLPNPAGDDGQFEEVTIRNTGTATLNLTGWILRDRGGLTWKLTGAIGAGQAQNFLRGGQPMTLNNSGDELVLIDPASAERDRFSYLSSSEGVRISTNH